VVIDLEPEQQRVVELAIQSGAFHNSNDVIATALSMLAEESKMGQSRKREAMSRASR
jgi:Arc/MetJ-type ribon-helix-helix transcriptional regulator